MHAQCNEGSYHSFLLLSLRIARCICASACRSVKQTLLADFSEHNKLIVLNLQDTDRNNSPCTLALRKDSSLHTRWLALLLAVEILNSTFGLL